MHSLTPASLRWLAQHHGMISTTRLLTCGVSRRAVNRLIGACVLIHEHKSVYRIASTPLTLEGRCAALSMAHPKGFITGPSAGRLIKLRRMPNGIPINLCVPHGLELAIPGVIVRQSTKVDATDFVRRNDGITIASAPRLAFDLAATLSPLDHASVVEQILHERLCGIDALAAIARRLAHPARPGSVRFVTTLSDRLPGGALESHPEVVVAKALQARGVPIHSQATWLQLPNGKRARLDVSVPSVRWGVEIDVHPSHLLLEGTTKDTRRDRQARLLGWQIDRVTGLDLLDFDATIDELVRLYEQRRDEFSPGHPRSAT